MPATDAQLAAALETATGGVVHLATIDGPACGAAGEFVAVDTRPAQVTCPACRPPARTITLRTHDGAYARNRIPASVHALANEVPGVVVGTACGRVFAYARTSGMTVGEGGTLTCSACREGRQAR